MWDISPFLVEWRICLARLWTPSDCAPLRLWLFLSHRRHLASAAALIPHQSLSETVPPLGIWSIHIDSKAKYQCMISVLKGQCGSGYCIYGHASYRTGKEKKHQGSKEQGFQSHLFSKIKCMQTMTLWACAQVNIWRGNHRITQDTMRDTWPTIPIISRYSNSVIIETHQKLQ